MTLFGLRLSEAMQKRDMTAAELSRKTSISESNISRYLAGTVEPKLRALLILADALNVSSDWLSGIEVKEDNRNPYEILYGEEELISMYSELSLAGKQKVLDYADYILNRERKDVQR